MQSENWSSILWMHSLDSENNSNIYGNMKAIDSLLVMLARVSSLCDSFIGMRLVIV